jgi:Na+/H+ antiporter NhaD/arsenite permease-like protein
MNADEVLGGELPLWSISFFAILLLSIAILPLAHPGFWDKNRNKAILSAALSIPVILLFAHYGDLTPLRHELKEYISFVVLLGSLFVVSGGLYISGDIEATPSTNTLLHAIGGVVANIVGTTGASMLLIRPLLRINSERKNTAHLPVFFIFIVSNIGGALIPLGDPPLFVGYLRGIPFFWTLKLFPEWLFMMSLVLAVLYFFDRYHWRREKPEDIQRDRENIEPLRMHGKINILLILGIVLSAAALRAPHREAVMITMAVLSLILTERGVRERNGFSFGPILEVAVLFAGIFITMVPVALVLEARGAALGISRPWHFFWVTGLLSSFLDNTPSYLTYLSLAQGLPHGVAALQHAVIGVPENILKAISLGAVFMGANTYIGNGPNFMVKVICEHHKVQVPSFFGYMLWSGSILIPLFIFATLLFL